MPPVALPIDLHSAAAARTLLCEALLQHGVHTRRDSRGQAGTVEDAVLMVSELVANAVRHPRALLLLDINIRNNTLHVAVVDDAPGLPSRTHEEHDRTSGRGLKIVDALADRWGCTPGPGRKTIWFEIALR